WKVTIASREGPGRRGGDSGPCTGAPAASHRRSICCDRSGRGSGSRRWAREERRTTPSATASRRKRSRCRRWRSAWWIAAPLAGTVDIELEREPLGTGSDGQPVALREIWPSQQEIASTVARALKPEQFAAQYANVFDGNPRWNAIPVGEGELYPWDPNSTYIH